jgi:16S rRNA (guanine527-N7)-methyltransferase
MASPLAESCGQLLSKGERTGRRSEDYVLLIFIDVVMEFIQKYFSDFTDVQVKQFAALKELYTEWNTKINVISRKDMDGFYEHHVLHALTIAAKFEFIKGMEVMDLGTGGGFPGIPLAIFFPDTHFHLVDSINKKLKVALEIAAAIGLKNLTIQHSRAEDIANRKFDVVVSRAVAPLKDLWHWSKPLLQRRKNTGENAAVPNGLICLKGGDLTQEIFESGCKPLIWEIEKIFQVKFFMEKYLLYVPLK